MAEQEYTYRAMWKILDSSMSLGELRTEACLVLDEMAAASGARIDGDPQWSIRGDVLVCEAPARPIGEVVPISAARRGAVRAAA